MDAKIRNLFCSDPLSRETYPYTKSDGWTLTENPDRDTYPYTKSDGWTLTENPDKLKLTHVKVA